MVNHAGNRSSPSSSRRPGRHPCASPATCIPVASICGPAPVARRAIRGGSEQDGAVLAGHGRTADVAPAPAGRCGRMTTGRIQEILPWLAHNAMIHYLAPRGLEQYSGGGWGTRDVCQGPVEMLLALGRWEPLRDLLLRVFKTAERRRRLAAMVHVLRARARHTADRTRTAISSSGRCWRWPSISSRRKTRRSSTRSFRSFITRATTAPRRPRSGDTSSAP